MEEPKDGWVVIRIANAGEYERAHWQTCVYFMAGRTSMMFSRRTTARPASGHGRWQNFKIYCSAAGAGADRGSYTYIYILNSPSGSGIPLRRWVMAIPVIGGMPLFLDNLACVGRGDRRQLATGSSWAFGVWGIKCG